MNNHLVKRLLSNQKGFTLAELIIVLAILGMLSAIAIPSFSGILDKSAERTDESNKQVVETAVETYRANTGALPTIASPTVDSTAFNQVVTKLYTDGYLKNTSISAKQNGKEFTYDSSKGTVSLQTTATTP